MTARVNKTPFQGSEVWVPIGKDFPFLIAGWIVLIFLFFMPLPAHATSTCNVYGAEYVPQKQINDKKYPKNKSDDRDPALSFVLRIEKGDGGQAFRSTFLYFDAFDSKGIKVSSMRLGDTHSNGSWTQGFSGETGQYYDPKDESTWKDFESAPGFIPLGVNEDFSQASLESAPYMLIFPQTYVTLRYDSYQVPENWDYYIKFYTEERIFPDFRGYDFWIRKKCGPAVKEKK